MLKILKRDNFVKKDAKKQQRFFIVAVLNPNNNLVLSKKRRALIIETSRKKFSHRWSKIALCSVASSTAAQWLRSYFVWFPFLIDIFMYIVFNYMDGHES